jgi:hypothetical protein
MPEQDPVYGTDGPLVRIWNGVKRREHVRGMEENKSSTQLSSL